MGRRLPGFALPAAGIGIPLLGVLVAILALGPYYGVVDDATLLGYVAQVGADGFPHAWADRLWSDITSWGMVRPFYWALAYPEYRAGAEGPRVLYVVNWAVTGSVLVFAGYALARAFRVSTARRGVFLAAYGAAVFVYPWTLDLFAFASYQEKWVVLAAAAGFLWFAEPRRELPAGAWYAISVLVVVLGSLTKAQFLVFVPGFLLLLLDQRRESGEGWQRVGAVATTGAAAAIAIRAVAWQGEYTQGYGLGNVPEQLQSRYLWLLAAWAAAWTAYALVRHGRGGTTLVRDLVPIAVFISFVAVFAQWPGGFLFSVIGFVAAGTFALAVARLGSGGLAAIAVTAAVVWACAWIWVRTDELYSSLASVGEFARSSTASELATAGSPVYISCEEGSQAIASYVARVHGRPLSIRPRKAVPWSSAKGSRPPPAFRFALVDAHLCPAAIDPAQWNTVWRPDRDGGFVLYRRTGG